MEEREEIRDEQDTPPMAGKHYSAIKEKDARNDSKRKQHGNKKMAYTDGPKSTEKKVSFADIKRIGALPEEASNHTA